MNDTIERNVTVNHDQELYVIQGGGGYSCLGFDVCLERIDRMTTELAGYGVMPERYIEQSLSVARGAIETYDTYVNLSSLLISTVEAHGARAVCELSPQLIDLEGYRVEVRDKHGETRRFIVGRSTGPIPCHLEIKRSNSSGGGPADREYESVRVIERVR